MKATFASAAFLINGLVISGCTGYWLEVYGIALRVLGCVGAVWGCEAILC